MSTLSSHYSLHSSLSVMRNRKTRICHSNGKVERKKKTKSDDGRWLAILTSEVTDSAILKLVHRQDKQRHVALIIRRGIVCSKSLLMKVR